MCVCVCVRCVPPNVLPPTPYTSIPVHGRGKSLFCLFVFNLIILLSCIQYAIGKHTHTQTHTQLDKEGEALSELHKQNNPCRRLVPRRK